MNLKSMLAGSFLSLLFLTASSLKAGNREALASAMNDFCTQITQCVMKDLESEDIPASVKDMAKQMASGMCKSFETKFDHSPENPEVEKQATLCIESMLKLGCEITEMDEETPECQALDNMEK